MRRVVPVTKIVRPFGAIAMSVTMSSSLEPRSCRTDQSLWPLPARYATTIRSSPVLTRMLTPLTNTLLPSGLTTRAAPYSLVYEIPSCRAIHFVVPEPAR